jgi:hypothetical protein
LYARHGPVPFAGGNFTKGGGYALLALKLATFAYGP